MKKLIERYFEDNKPPKCSN